MVLNKSFFTRMIYDNSTIEDFPVDVRKSVRENHRGELYIDFYKCVQQGLIEDENLIQELYKIIHSWLSYVVMYLM